MAAPAESIELLKELLRTNQSAVALLRRLIALGPKSLVPARRTLVLFEAVNVLNLENPHSDYLTWLLDPAGPLRQSWLLRRVLELVAPEVRWTDDVMVEREVTNSGGRADILVSVGGFKLVIENKVWSIEGENQVARYLKGFDIESSSDGLVVFLTPHGTRSRSVCEADRRVCTMSYRQLADLIDAGLAAGDETEPRGMIFAREFRNSIHRLLKLRFDMKKPAISEATKLLLTNARQFDALKKAAIDESAEFVQWLYFEAERRLAHVLGTEAVAKRYRSGVLVRLPSWQIAECEYGIAIDVERDPQKHFLGALQPWVGVTIRKIDEEPEKTACEPISVGLHGLLSKVWANPADLFKREYGWPLWRYVPFPPDGDLELWSEESLKLMEEMAKKLSRTLTKAAAALIKSSRV